MSIRRRLLVLLTLCGLLLNVLLLFWKLTGPGLPVAGCGGGGCSDVLVSRWSQVFGIPVVFPGVAAYLLLFAALVWRKETLAAFCYAAIGGAALWLMFAQSVILKQFCPWCMAAHATGLAIAGLGLAGGAAKVSLQAGAAAALVLALGQLYGPVPASHRITSESHADRTASADIHGRGEGRKATFDDGRKIFNVSALPHLGSPEAKHVLIEYHDFQCPACRTMGGYLGALVEKHPDKVCVIHLPVPLDKGCNAQMKASETDHPGSCALARIALAVWRADQSVYPQIHRRFISEPPPDEKSALGFVHQLIDPATLATASRDPWIDELIRADIADWTVLSSSSSNRQLPKLFIRDKRILHGLPPGEAEFISVIENELGL